MTTYASTEAARFLTRALLAINGAHAAQEEASVADHTYVPNEDSPMGLAYNAWRAGADALRMLDLNALEELESVARYRLSIPAYANDAQLQRFHADVSSVLTDAYGMRYSAT